MTKKLTGTQIKEMLETSLTIQKNCIVANDSGSYLQVGGIIVRFDPAQPSKEQPEAVKTEVKKEQASGTKTSVKSPKTADSNELFCWMILLLLSGGAGSICLVQGNKR